MKKLYIWTFVLSFLGIIAAFYLIPSESEIAFLQIKSQQYEEAKEFYEKEYAKDKKNPRTLFALSRIEENQGHIRKAIALMEEYITIAPNDSKGYRRLADLYLIDQNMPQYVKNLLILEKLNPKKVDSPLAELISWYFAKGETGPLTGYLEKVISLRLATESDYLMLAGLYAKDKKYKEALHLLETRRLFFLKSVNINEIFFEIYLYEMLSTDMAKTIPLLVDYLLYKKHVPTIYYAVNTFKEKYPGHARALLKALEPFSKIDIKLDAVTLLLEWDDPKIRDEVLARLKQKQEGYFDDPPLQNLAFGIFLQAEDPTALLFLIRNSPAEKLEERNIVGGAIMSLKRKSPLIAKAMQKELPPSYLKSNSMIDTALSIGAQEVAGKEKLDALIAKGNITPLKAYFLIQIAAEAGFEKEVLELGKSLIPYYGRDSFEMVNIAKAYIEVGKAKNLVDLVKNSRDFMGKEKVDLVFAVLDIPLGRPKKTANWIRNTKKIDRSTLEALYSVAEKFKEYPLALYIAKRQLKDTPSFQTELVYAKSLVQVGKADKGLSLLEKLYREHPSLPIAYRTYFSALVFAAKKNPTYIPRTLLFMEKMGPIEDLPDSMQKEFAYTYLDLLHDFPKAEKIFWRLARRPTRSVEDVETLIYLWGPNPSEKQVEWVKNLTEQSEGSAFALWLNSLVFMGQNESAITLFQEKEGLLPIEAYFAYMNALSYEKKFPELKKALDKTLPLAENLQEFYNLSIFAKQAKYLSIREKIWEKATFLYPDSLLAWESLAESYFDAHNYKKAKKALDEVLSLPGDGGPFLYQDYYRYGEILYNERSYQEARKYYVLSLKTMREKEESNYEMDGYKAVVLYRLGATTESRQVAKDLYEKTGKDPDAAAAYATLLIDMDRIKPAEDVLIPPEECP